ncbi:hypothetical protein ACWF9B_08735 [Streptomyces sp. NPDC055089]
MTSGSDLLHHERDPFPVSWNVEAPGRGASSGVGVISPGSFGKEKPGTLDWQVER